MVKSAKAGGFIETGSASILPIGSSQLKCFAAGLLKSYWHPQPPDNHLSEQRQPAPQQHRFHLQCRQNSLIPPNDRYDPLYHDSGHSLIHASHKGE